MAQLSGDGSETNPFYGTITTDVEWDWDAIGVYDGNIYIGTSSNNDLTIGNGGHLTILPGATLVFTQPTSDLKVTGTGRITANATPGAKIIFTKASANDSWGHLIFDGMSGSNTSLIDNCIFEYGKLTGTTLAFSNAGGGICANYSYVTIQNTTFRNNYALFGGGLFIGIGQNPTVRNCKFEDNTARDAGGGIYIYDNSAVQIENCIFDGNHANGITASYYAGGGIQFGKNTSNAKVINSTFVNNTATRSGDAVYFLTSGSIVNCVLWGSDDQITFRSSAGTVVNSAIENLATGSRYTDCIALNSSNTASDGPNFTATNGSDWSIKFISPLRDKGTSTGAPSTDIKGKQRIGAPDIGAYEVQYSLWTGASGTSWGTAGNWAAGVTPAIGTGDVIIPSSLENYPVSTGTSYTMPTGTFLIIQPGAKATFDVLTNNGGTLRLMSDATAIASLKFSSYTDNGTEDISMYLTGGGGPAYRWHYVAVPANMNKSVFTNINPYNLLRFDDSRIETINMEGWQWHDGYDEETQTTNPADAFTTLQTGRGYNFYHTEAVTVRFPTVTGLVNAIDAIIPLQFNGNGLNLLGNSLTCSIDWDEAAISGNMRNAIYFTRNNSLVAYVDEVGSPLGVTGIIPPLHGFFVKALEEGCTVDLSGTNVRTHGTVNRYKGKQAIPLLRLELLAGEVLNDETVVRFSNDATTGFDNKSDASKLFASKAPASTVWSEIDNEKYIINAIPFPENEFLLPVAVNIKESGSYSLRRTEITGLEDYNIELVDNDQAFTTDLKETPLYTFSSDQGVISDRFVLKITPMASGLDDIVDREKEINVFIYGDLLNIQPVGDNWTGRKTEITLYDLTGRVIDRHSDMELYKGGLIQLPFNRAKGVYIIEIREGSRRVIQKISKQ